MVIIKRSNCIILIFLMVFFNNTFFSQDRKTSDVIILYGEIISMNGKPISGVDITLDSNKWIYKTQTDKDGKYEILVNRGIYKLFTQSIVTHTDYNDINFLPKDFQSYFRPSTRAKIDLTREEFKQKSEIAKVKIDMVLVESSTIFWDGTQNEGNGSASSYSPVSPYPKIRYDTIDMGNAENSLDIVIQYGFKEEKKNITSYFTAINADFDSIFGKGFPFTVISYDKLTIYASRAFYDKKNKIIEIKEAFLAENEKEIYKAKIVKISLKNSKPSFDIKGIEALNNLNSNSEE